MHPALEKGNVAVITGAASGIGLATAKYLASKGLRVCLADRDADGLAAAQVQIIASGALEKMKKDTDDHNSGNSYGYSIHPPLGFRR